MTAFIPINEKYRIELDHAAWQVSKWKPRKRHPESGAFEGITWHRTLQQAGEYLIHRLLYEEEGLEGTQEIIDALHASSRLIAIAIKEGPLPDSWVDAKRQSLELTEGGGDV